MGNSVKHAASFYNTNTGDDDITYITVGNSSVNNEAGTIGFNEATDTLDLWIY